MKIFALVCPNGLGHFRRTVAVLDRLLDIHSNIEIDLACRPWQVERLSRTFDFSQKWTRSVNYFHDITETVTFWTSDRDIYRTGALMKWEERLDTLDIDAYDIVLSDNLTGVLSRRPDAILMGSFLWSDVLENVHIDIPEVEEFVAHERKLLDRVRPPMLSVGDLAMPGVLERTRAIKCNFMFYDGFEPKVLQSSHAPPWRIAVLSGANNNTCREIHEPLIEYLEHHPDWIVALPEESRNNANFPAGSNSVSFDFSASAYRSCDIVVARPGMGTIHDTLAAGSPLLCSYENSLEMSHLARRVEELGLGVDFGSDTDPNAFAGSLQSMLVAEHRNRYSRARARLGKDGLDQVVTWLAGYIGACSTIDRSTANNISLLGKQSTL